MVQELTTLMVERLQSYERKNRQLPDRIIIFRDGVSEVIKLNLFSFATTNDEYQGQFDLVREKELPRIEEAFKKFDTKARGKPYRPAVTINVCGKRHHAKFTGTLPDNTVMNGNTVPGTCVDKGVTDIYNFDYYLQVRRALLLISVLTSHVIQRARLIMAYKAP